MQLVVTYPLLLCLLLRDHAYCLYDPRSQAPPRFSLLMVSPLSPFYHLSTLDVTHVRKDTRPSAFFVQLNTARAWERGYIWRTATGSLGQTCSMVSWFFFQWGYNLSFWMHVWSCMLCVFSSYIADQLFQYIARETVVSKTSSEYGLGGSNKKERWHTVTSISVLFECVF